MFDRERERERVCVCLIERESVCVFDRERGRDRERDRQTERQGGKGWRQQGSATIRNSPWQGRRAVQERERSERGGIKGWLSGDFCYQTE